MVFKTIFTHDEAMLILEDFEEVLMDRGICVPSPEDEERDDADMTGLYGSTYSMLLGGVEDRIIDILNRRDNGEAVISGVFSGT